MGETTVEPGSLADLNWDEPSEEKKAEWKKKYGETRVKTASFVGPVPGRPDIPMMNFCYLTMGRKEYRELMGDIAAQPEDREDNICQKLVIWPEKIDFKGHFSEDQEKAGTPTRLVEAIFASSGFQPPVAMGNL